MALPFLVGVLTKDKYCWYQCTVKGGREGRDIDAVQLASTCELLGEGIEIRKTALIVIFNSHLQSTRVAIFLNSPQLGRIKAA